MVAWTPTEPDQAPPHDPQIERAVLGACLLTPRAVERTRDLLRPESFYLLPHQLVYSVCLGLYDRSEAIDQLTTAAELKRRDQLDEAGGVVYLAQLAAEVVTSANCEYHARIVAELALRRRVLALNAQIARRAMDLSLTAAEVVSEMETRLVELQGGNADPGLQSHEQVLAATLAGLEALAQQRGQLTGVTSGLRALDRLTGGWQPGDLVVVGARPGMGKTALSLLWADQAARAGKTVVYVSLEMLATQLGQRYLCMSADLNLQRVRTGSLSPAEWRSITKTAANTAHLPLWIHDRSDLSAMEIRGHCRRLQREHGLGLVIVDYLQLLRADERAETREREVANMSRAMKRLAKELGVPVIVLSQLSRALEGRPDRRPRLADLRESGSLEQDADVVLMVYRPEVYGIDVVEVEGRRLPSEGLAELIVAKQRNGPAGESIWLQWLAEYTRFEERMVEPERIEVGR